MTIPNHARSNFHTLFRAAADGNLALMECLDSRKSEPRYVLCAVGHDGTDRCSHRLDISPTATPTTLICRPILTTLKVFWCWLRLDPKAACQPPRTGERAMRTRRKPRPGEQPNYLVTPSTRQSLRRPTPAIIVRQLPVRRMSRHSSIPAW